MHRSKNRRGTVEVLPGKSAQAQKKFPKTQVNFWRDRLRRQRYGSKQDGTYRELQSFYVRIYHQGREHAFTLHTLNETVAATHARDIYVSILKEGWDAVLLKHRSSGEQSVNDPTVGQFLGEVEAKAGLRNRTFRNYTNCFRNHHNGDIQDQRGGKQIRLSWRGQCPMAGQSRCGQTVEDHAGTNPGLEGG